MAESTQFGAVSYWTSAAMKPRASADDTSSPESLPTAVLREQISDMTVSEFVERKFLPEHIATKRTPGRRHYQAILKHIIAPDSVDRMFRIDAERSKTKLRANPTWPYVDHMRLQDLQQEHIQRLISAALEAGYSTQTAKHIRSVLSAIVAHAIREGHFKGGNPAILVSLPGMRRKTSHALTFEQTVRALQSMRYPEFEMTLIAILTGMNIAEICGLQWKYINATDQHVSREGEIIFPRTIAVRKQWYRGELSTVPEARKKNIPIPDLLRRCFQRLGASRSGEWNEFVLASRSGKPINQINVAARRLKIIGEQLEIPWISWQVFRRTRISLINEFGAQLQRELAMALTLIPDAVSPLSPMRRGR